MSLDERGGTTGTRRDRSPAPPPKPKPPKQPPKPKPNPFAGLPGTVDPRTGKVAPAWQPKPPKPWAKEILRRQQLLIANGYPIVADGVWGPRSQRAWVEYLKRNAAGKTPPFRKEGALGNVSYAIDQTVREGRPEGATSAVTIEERAAFEAREMERIRRERVMREMRAKEALWQRAVELAKNPKAARTMKFHDLAKVLLDREVGFDVAKKPAAARALQEHLIAHGYEGVKVTGKFDVQTAKAFKDRWDKTVGEQQRRDSIMVAKSLYKGAAIQAGDKVDWLPLPGNVVPTEKKMAELLQAGGFTAEMVFAAMLEQVKRRNESFDSYRHVQLLAIAAQVAGPSLDMATAYGLIGTENLPDWQIAAMILGVRDFLPGIDTQGMSEFEKRQAMRWRANSDDNQLQNKRAYDNMLGQVKALMTSQSHYELEEKLAAYAAEAEAKFAAIQKQIAHESTPWWGKGVEVAMAPGEYIRTGIIYAGMALNPGRTRVHYSGGGMETGGLPEWEDAEKVLAEMPLIPRLIFELTVDPLNIIAPARIGSTALKTALRVEKMGGYSFGKMGEGFLGLGVKYTRGTWTKTGYGQAFLRATQKVDDPLGIANTALGRRLEQVANKTLLLKDEAARNAQKYVASGVRHNFDKMRTALPGYKAADTATAKKSRPKLDSSATALKAHLEQMDEVEELLKWTRGNLASLFTHPDGDGKTSLYASVYAYSTELARVGAIHQVATEATWDRFSALRRRAIDSGLWREDMAEEEAKALLDQLADEALREYHVITASIGVHGAVRPAQEMAQYELLDAERVKNLVAEVSGRVKMRQDELENSILPAIQSMVEEEADRAWAAAKLAAKKAGLPEESVPHPLWDDSGEFLARSSKGEASEELRRVLAASFDEDAMPMHPNPRYGIGHSWYEAREAIDAEVRERTARLTWWHARAVDEGTLPPRWKSGEVTKEDALDDLRRQVEGHWDRSPSDGKFYDERKMIPVSELYVRHTDFLVGGRGADAVRSMLREGEYNPLAAPLELSGETAFGQQMWRLSWLLGSAYKMRLPMGRHAFGRRFDALPAGSEAATGEELSALVSKSIAESRQLRELIALRQSALADAWDEVLPKALLNESAVMAAWGKAQSLPLKYTYKVITGGTNLWVFATLPLRQGWLVRNIVDGISKAWTEGLVNPKLLFMGAEKPGANLNRAVRTVFDIDIDMMRQLVRFIDRLRGTNVSDGLDDLVERTWQLPTDVLHRIFKSHGIEVPEHRLANAAFTPFVGAKGERFLGRPRVDEEELFHAERGLDPLLGDGQLLPDELKELEKIRAAKAERQARSGSDAAESVSFRDRCWALFGTRPENYMRRMVYRGVYRKTWESELKAGTHKLELLPPIRPVRFDDLQLDDDAVKRLRAELRIPGDVKLEFKAAKQPRGADIDGKYDPNTRTATVLLDPDALLGVRSAEHLEAGLSQLVGLVIHELRHAWQFEKPRVFQVSQKSIRAYKKVTGELQPGKDVSGWKQLLYQLQPHELDADLHRVLRSDRHKGLIRYTGPRLPSQVDRVALETAAHDAAWAAVVKTMFDYSQVTVLEENLKVFFPFIQFWRKNTNFWMYEAIPHKPWLTNAALQLERERQNAHADLPAWMRRYISTDEIADAAAVVPGLDAVVRAALPDNVMYDPVNMMSFAPLYRQFKSQNQNMPADKMGWAIFGPMIDAFNDWGLGLNPFIRKPLENLGVANQRSWQTIFPQTNTLAALTRKFLGEKAALTVAQWEGVFSLFQGDTPSDEIVENYDYWVQTEIANQVARGEEPNLEAAKTTIDSWFLLQNVWGYFSGMYFRRATPEDIYLSTMYDDLLKPGGREWDNMPPKEEKMMRLWSMRGMDRMTYGRYLELLPTIETYYRLTDWDAKQQLKQANPEIIRWVDPVWRGKPLSAKYVQSAQKYTDTEGFMEALDIARTLDLDSGMREAARRVFVSPQLEEWWKKNDTPQRIRERMVQAEAYDYYDRLSKGYFSLPEDDFEAREGYLAEHPELADHWNQTRDPDNDYEAVYGAINHSLREMYFAIVKADGWDKAAPFLKQFPFMFEGTKSEKKIKDGAWIPGGGKWSAQRVKDFGLVKPHLTWFFSTFLPKIGKKKAFAWLEKSDTPQAKLIREYLKKYPSAKRLAYLKAEPWLKLFFGMPKAERSAWLKGDSEGAAILRHFFAKYGDKMSQHGKDYLAAKADLDFYFKIPKEKRDEWLKSGDARAIKVLAYFKKYGKANQFERAFKKLIEKHPGLKNGTPEQVKRIAFWEKFFALPPDQRASFVTAESEAHGIFIYGEFGEHERYDQEQEFMRRAIGAGVNQRQAAFLYVKPLLAFYRTLDGEEKSMFLRANQELQDYFNKFQTKSLTGDKRLDAEVEAYFKLPPDSFARSEFLKTHPHVQDWFDEKSSPAAKAMRNSLEQYFALAGRVEREEYLQDHPEVAAYFEQRREEKSLESSIYRSFDNADPRLRPYYESVEDMERAAAAMRDRLRRAALDTFGDITTRRERRPA